MNQRFVEKLLAEGVRKEKLLTVAIKRLSAHVADGFPVSAANQLLAKTKEQAAKLDRCVEDILSRKDFTPKKGRTRKESAFAICTSQILGSRGFSPLAFLRQIAVETGATLTPQRQAQEILQALRHPESVEYKSYLTLDKKSLDKASIMDDLLTFHVMSGEEAREVVRLLDLGWKTLTDRAKELSRQRELPVGASKALEGSQVMVDGVMIPTSMTQQKSRSETLFEEGEW